MLRSLMLLSLFAMPLPQSPPSEPLSDGGEVSVTRGEFVHIAIKGPRAGLATVCLAEASRVRVLHASAAVGEAIYASEGSGWKLVSGFEWKLREAPARGEPTPEAVAAFLETHGWVANASNNGSAVRRFRIRTDQGVRFVGVAYLSYAPPMAVSYWPRTMDDDCRAIEIGQGQLPAAGRFQPERWYQLR